MRPLEISRPPLNLNMAQASAITLDWSRGRTVASSSFTAWVSAGMPDLSFYSVHVGYCALLSFVNVPEDTLESVSVRSGQSEGVVPGRTVAHSNLPQQQLCPAFRSGRFCFTYIVNG